MITIHGSHYNVHFLSTLVSLCQHQVIRGWAGRGREGVRLGMGELSGRVQWLVVEVDTVGREGKGHGVSR